jgi:AcrR family transcriptional regulator
VRIPPLSHPTPDRAQGPPPPGKTRRERSAAFRSLLLVAVERLLAEATFADITIDSILAEAKVSRSTFYSYFQDKAALLLALAEDIFREALTVAEPWWQFSNEPTREGLEDALGGVFDLYAERRAVIGAVVEAAGYEPSVREWFTRSQDGAIAALTQHIRGGQAAGTIRPELTAPETAGWLVWMIERGLYQMAGAASTAQAGRLLRALTDIVWFVLYTAAEA